LESGATFEHRHYAHCESGVLSALFRHHGLDLSEPMVFGLSGALGFAYLPFLRLGNMPLIAYRMFPAHLIKKLPRRLRVDYFRKRYSDAGQAMAELDDFLARGQIVGIQMSVFFAPYFPPEMRFPFNAHNAIVIGRENGDYLISDPVFDEIKRIASRDLQKARFAKGLLAPRGLVHFPLQLPSSIDLEPAIRISIKKTVNMMLHAPPFIGLKGIQRLAADITSLPEKHEQKFIRHFLGHLVRMQEEIGTGGGGFRFLYAAFLQEAYQLLGIRLLQEASRQMTAAGDAWRVFALACAKAVKHKQQAVDLTAIADLLRQCGEAEKELYLLLKTLKRHKTVNPPGLRTP
jgi:Domain of unknown function (DUF4872)/Butirosin biosynthesis protein H, N-terminal